MKKIQNIARRLEEYLAQFDPRVLEQAVQSAALFSFSKYQPDAAPSLDFIRGLEPYEGIRSVEGEEDTHPDWRALLSEYGFAHMDEFDRVIMSGIERGHFDPADLEREASHTEDRIRRVDEDQSFSDAWNLYHDSLADNADEVMNRLSQAVFQSPRVVSPTNLSGTVALLKELGWKGDISSLLQAYANGHADRGRDFWDLEGNTFGSNVSDPDVRQLFFEQMNALLDERSPEDILIRIGRTKSWNPEDLHFLGSLPVDEFYAIFKRLSGPNLRHAISGAMLFRVIDEDHTGGHKLFELAEAALIRIGSETDINRQRVKQRGIKLPPERC